MNAATGNALDDRWRDTSEGALVWGYATSLGDPAQTWMLETTSGRAVGDGTYRVVSTIDPSSGIAPTATGCAMSKSPTTLHFSYDEGTGFYTATAGGLALAMSGPDVSLAAPDGSASQQWSLVRTGGGYAIVNAATGNALDDRWRDTSEGALVWGYASSLGDPAQTWTLETI